MKISHSLLVLSLFCFGIAHADIVRFTQVAPGIYRGGQPETEADYDMLKSHGIKSILNLRKDATVAPEQALAAKLGFNFLNIPMSGFAYPGHKNIDEALNWITDPAVQPVFVHCHHGKDRTGLVIGLYRNHNENWPAKRAYKEMRSFGFNPWLMGLTAYFWSHVEQNSAALDDSDDFGLNDAELPGLTN